MHPQKHKISTAQPNAIYSYISSYYPYQRRKIAIVYINSVHENQINIAQSELDVPFDHN